MAHLRYRHTNRLIHENSPYLLQHAHNPVDWYPWGEVAFQKAKQEGKPVFLSVGYSTCHWCHVMEHESFENEAIADIMNKHYVNIKVDREENPGVDKLYMTYLQLTSGSAGWPMSLFLTPKLHPFFGSTYFSPVDQYGKPGFKTILTRIAQVWAAQPDKLIQSSQLTLNQFKEYIQSGPSEPQNHLDPWKVAESTYDHFHDSFDASFGGFGGAPKFPTPVQLNFLLDYHIYTKNQPSKTLVSQRSLDMVLFTLKKISAGGIHDHIGSGFHRYSTDHCWHIPHFEKMLYDQAQLLSLYVIAYQITQETVYADVAKDIILYVSRDLQHKQGAFYCAEDADSLPNYGTDKKHEGAFCVWEAVEIDKLLDSETAILFKYYFGVKKYGNVAIEQDPHNELQNKNVLMQCYTIEEAAAIAGMSVEKATVLLEHAKETLWRHRRTSRPGPHRDEKILTCWNGLMISGLTRAYQVFRDSAILDLAIRTANFVYKELYLKDSNTLLRCYCKAPSTIEGFADDYSFWIQGLLDLYETTFDDSWLLWAYDLQEKQNKLFYDKESGGYFNVSEKDTNIFLRLKDEQDGAEPSSNAISLRNLVRLGTLFEEHEYLKKAQSTVDAFHLALSKFPFALPAFTSSLLILTKGVKEIIITGDLSQEKILQFEAFIHRPFIPNRLVARATVGGVLSKRNAIFADIALKHGDSKTPVARICENFTCGLSISNEEELEKKLLA